MTEKTFKYSKEFKGKIFHTKEIPKDIDIPHIQIYDVEEVLDKDFEKKQKINDLKINCCHHTLFGWGCTERTGENAPNGKPLNCRSCRLFGRVLDLK